MISGGAEMNKLGINLMPRSNVPPFERLLENHDAGFKGQDVLGFGLNYSRGKVNLSADIKARRKLTEHRKLHVNRDGLPHTVVSYTAINST